MSLIICKNKVSRDELINMSTPKPDGRWHPISHHTLAKLTYDALIAEGYEIVEEDHGVARQCKKDPELWQRYFGGFALTREDVAGSTRRVVCGIRNSLDKSFAAALVIGNHMMVCENLDFNAEIKIARKHTTNIMRDLPDLIRSHVGVICKHWMNMENRIAAYKDKVVSEQKAVMALTHLVDIESLTSRDLYPAITLFRDPAKGARAMIDKEDFRDDAGDIDVNAYNAAVEERKAAFLAEFGTLNGLRNGNLWSLYNAFTYVMKGSDLSQLPSRTMAAQAYFDSLCGFTPDPISVEVNEAPLTPQNVQAEEANKGVSEAAEDDGENTDGGAEYFADLSDGE